MGRLVCLLFREIISDTEKRSKTSTVEQTSMGNNSHHLYAFRPLVWAISPLLRCMAFDVICAKFLTINDQSMICAIGANCAQKGELKDLGRKNITD